MTSGLWAPGGHCDSGSLPCFYCEMLTVVRLRTRYVCLDTRDVHERFIGKLSGHVRRSVIGVYSSHAIFFCRDRSARLLSLPEAERAAQWGQRAREDGSPSAHCELLTPRCQHSPLELVRRAGAQRSVTSVLPSRHRPVTSI